MDGSRAVEGAGRRVDEAGPTPRWQLRQQGQPHSAAQHRTAQHIKLTNVDVLQLGAGFKHSAAQHSTATTDVDVLRLGAGFKHARTTQRIAAQPPTDADVLQLRAGLTHARTTQRSAAQPPTDVDVLQLGACFSKRPQPAVRHLGGLGRGQAGLHAEGQLRAGACTAWTESAHSTRVQPSDSGASRSSPSLHRQQSSAGQLACSCEPCI